MQPVVVLGVILVVLQLGARLEEVAAWGGGGWKSRELKLSMA
jgi:hypothetical protein